MSAGWGDAFAYVRLHREPGLQGCTLRGNSTGAIPYSVVSGPATISGNTVTLTGSGTVTLQASQVAAGTYDHRHHEFQCQRSDADSHFRLNPGPDLWGCTLCCLCNLKGCYYLLGH
jgi:hypothetical protein